MERPRTSSDTPSPVVLPCESTSENSECSLELSSMQDDQLSPDLLLVSCYQFFTVIAVY